MNPIDALILELDAWRAAGRVAWFWWRDDDLGRPTERLDPLLATAIELDLAPLLAVVPAWATPDLPKCLAGGPARVAVHGLAHVDHEAGRGKKSEFGATRSRADRARDIADGERRLADLLGDDLIRCFVPPWNRLSPDSIRVLPSLGFTGLSTFAPRANASPVAGLIQVNTHVDLIDWHGDRGFVGRDAMAGGLATQLYRRRGHSIDPEEPIGLLTHHLEMARDDWRGFNSVCTVLKTHDAAGLLDPRDIF